MTRLHILLPTLLLSFSGQMFAEKQPQDAPVKKQEGDLVLVEAFDAGLVRKTLAHKAFSPDKKLFAGYYRDGFDEVISIHETKSGKQIRRIVGHGDDVRELKFTPDGKILASRCENRNRKGWALWNVDSGELILRLPVPPVNPRKTAEQDGAEQPATAPESNSEGEEKLKPELEGRSQ
jgi:WD40 repeat protein